jgi:hypothetical protein
MNARAYSEGPSDLSDGKDETTASDCADAPVESRRTRKHRASNGAIDIDGRFPIVLAST